MRSLIITDAISYRTTIQNTIQAGNQVSNSIPIDANFQNNVFIF